MPESACQLRMPCLQRLSVAHFGTSLRASDQNGATEPVQSESNAQATRVPNIRPPMTGLQPRAPPIEDTAAVLQAQMNKIATIYVVATKNNTICTLVDMKGQPIAVASAGSVGFKNSRKSTPYAAQATGERIVEKAMEKGYFQARIVMKGLGITKQSAVRALAKSRIKILEVHEHTSVPHNGCRQPRRRRI